MSLGTGSIVALTVAGTEYPLTAVKTPAYGIFIEPHESNTGDVLVGIAGNCILRFGPGHPIAWLPFKDATDVRCKGTVNADQVRWAPDLINA